MTTLVDDPALPRPGDLIDDRYEVGEVLGQGGFAVVYRATDRRRNAEVAVKVLDPIMSRRDDFASRFQREVELVSKLQHHHTIKVFDTGETTRGCLFLVMELLDGHSLEQVLEAQGQLDPERVRRIATQILRSLNEAHGIGIIHRDLKPGNVFLAEVAGEPDYVKVLDFGIAKTIDESADTSLTATGQVMCSPHYVAPERVAQQHTVPASDLYSLGVMLIELLEGRPPYDAETPMMLAVRHMRLDEPVPMSDAVRNSPLGPVLARATAKRLDDRFGSAAEMLGALESLPALPSEPLPVAAGASHTSHERAVGSVTHTQPEGRSISDRLPPMPAAPHRGGSSASPWIVGIAAVVLMCGVAIFVVLWSVGRQADSDIEGPAGTVQPLAAPQSPEASETQQPSHDPGATEAEAPARVEPAAGEPGGEAGGVEPLLEELGADSIGEAHGAGGLGLEGSPPAPPRRTAPVAQPAAAPAPPREPDPSPEPVRIDPSPIEAAAPTATPEPEPPREPEPTRIETSIVGERGARDIDAGGYVRERDAGSSGGGYFGR